MHETLGSEPFFSVISVCRDHCEGLRATWTSLAAQTWGDYEWIVIDGGSQDGTQAFLEALDDVRLSWVSETDEGIYDAMNKGLARARGRYVLFLNAGDALAGAGVFARIAGLCDQGADFVYGDLLERLENGEVHYKPAKSVRALDWGLFTHHQAMFYVRGALVDLRYDLRYQIAADYDLTARFLKDRDCVVRRADFAVCVFEGGGLSQRSAGQGRGEQFAARRALGMGLIRNGFIYAAQALVWRIRQVSPRLYWHLKSSGNTARADGPVQNPGNHP